MIHWPGARSERNEALLEKEETSSAVVPREPSSVEPTLTALEIHAGEESAFVKPSFPAAITVAMSADLRLSMIGFSGSTSQFESNRPPPRLMLTAAKLSAARRLNTRCSPAIMSEVKASAQGEGKEKEEHVKELLIIVKIWTAMILAPFATPENGATAPS